ncbi:MAG: kinase [Woeseiaceae bacterium]|nr:kinase [Woeseiaceae bacterium]
MRDDSLTAFIEKHRLPGAFRIAAREHFEPLAEWLAGRHEPGHAMLSGINGAQGTGKSTLADFLALFLAEAHRWRVAVISIDDFYLTRDERQALADRIHPLLATRGVPGTHDVAMMRDCIERLRTLRTGQTASLPRFDKAADDRADPSGWPIVEGPIDLVILEGWCVGSMPQPESALSEPVNDLERNEDPDGTWRRYVNDRLASDYAPVFESIDALVALVAPDFESILRWRIEQEQKLRATASDSSRTMDDAAVARFVQHFERLTRHNLDVVPQRADVVLGIAEDHTIISSTYGRRR